MIDKEPGFLSALIFKAKTAGLTVFHVLKPKATIRFHETSPRPRFDGGQVTRITSELWNNDQVNTEKVLEAGKVHNLRLASQGFKGIFLRAGETLSFWKQVGPPTRLRGFVKGRELREGCLVAAVGGGLCQLSNTLYEAALGAGLEIVERHAHTQQVPGSKAALGLDATVFYNYVDLRVRAVSDSYIQVGLSARELVVTIETATAATIDPRVPKLKRALPIIPNSCASCGRLDCNHNVEIELADAVVNQTAYLFDEYWPEFDFLLQEARPTDYVHLPVDGQRRKRPNYAWQIPKNLRVIEEPFFALGRSIKSRRLKAQGAERQKTLLNFERVLAQKMARRLRPETTRLIVCQTLLPHLEELGVLGGREVIVCVNRPPLFILQEKLDLALANNKHSRTLGDFRAPVEFVARERECLERAQEIISPHVLLAQYFTKVRLVPWLGRTSNTLKPLPQDRLPKLGFLGPTLGRKGAFEARETMRRLAQYFEFVVFGPLIEVEDFWRGLNIDKRPRANALNITDLDCVIAPSYIENSPRHLIEALNQGIRVIATRACGLGEQEGLLIIENPDPDQFELALKAYLASNK